MRWSCVHVDPQRRFSLDVEEESGRTVVSIPVWNGTAEYEERYEVDAPGLGLTRTPDPGRLDRVDGSCAWMAA